MEQALMSEGGRKLICCQNSFSRTALHIAVLAQHEDIVAYLVQNVPELLRIGDNVSVFKARNYKRERSNKEKGTESENSQLP